MKKIKIYDSLEQAELDAIAEILGQSPVERLRETVELILRTYNTTREELKSRKSTKTIRILSKS